MGGWPAWYNTEYRQVVLCWDLSSPLLSAGNNSFYLGFRSELLITVIRAAAINNVLAWPVNVRSIWSPARQAWTLRTTHGLYCIKLKHAETEWIYQLWSFSSLSLTLVPRPSQTSHFSVSDLLLFLRLQTSNTEWLHFLLLWEQWCEQLANYQAVNSRSQNKLNLPQILEIIKFLPSLPQQQLWSRAQWNSNVLMIERALSSQLTTPSTPLCSAGTVGRCGWGELNRLAE